MSKSLTEMAAEIIAARVAHEAMTSKQIASCLDDTFEALQKLKEREDAILGNAVQPIIKSEKPLQEKQEELEKPAVQEPIEKSEEPEEMVNLCTDELSSQVLSCPGRTYALPKKQ